MSLFRQRSQCLSPIALELNTFTDESEDYDVRLLKT